MRIQEECPDTPAGLSIFLVLTFNPIACIDIMFMYDIAFQDEATLLYRMLTVQF
jgi:hypothetical protein